MPKLDGRIINIAPPPTMKIHTETTATRCDICHQSDLFDAVNNHCSRCAGINLSALLPSQQGMAQVDVAMAVCMRRFGAMVGASLGGGLALLITIMAFLINPAQESLLFTWLSLTLLFAVPATFIGMINANFILATDINYLNTMRGKFDNWLVCTLLSAFGGGVIYAGLGIIFALFIAGPYSSFRDGAFAAIGLVGAIISGFIGAICAVLIIYRQVQQYNRVQDNTLY